MNFKLVIYFYILLNVGVFSIKERIVGGENADIKNFPYLVSLRCFTTNAHFCGGSIISKQHVLTVAHCIINKEPYTDIRIYAGSSSSVLTNGASYKIKFVNFHPGYMEEISKISKYHHDIAVITVQKIIQFGRVQMNIRLPIFDVVDSANAVIAGWGVLAYKSIMMSDQLQQAQMTILDTNTCKNAISFIHKEQICAYQKIGTGACIGDSGSPLISNDVIVGIATYAIPCGRGLPDVYTNVYSYLEFINSIVYKK